MVCLTGEAGLSRLNASPAVVMAPRSDATTQGFNKTLVSQKTGIRTNQSHCILTYSSS